MPTITEIHRDNARGRRALNDRSVVRCPGITAVCGPNNACFCRAACTDPCALLSLRGDASAAGRKRSFAVLRWRQPITDVLPIHTTARADHGQPSSDRLGHGYAAPWRPERKAVIEAIRVLVL